MTVTTVPSEFTVATAVLELVYEYAELLSLVGACETSDYGASSNVTAETV